MTADTRSVPTSGSLGRSRRTGDFDPNRLAYYEAEGWRMYYDRNWPRFLWLMLRMEREQFGFTWIRAAQGAYYVLKASVVWVPRDHDVRAVHRYLLQFYRLAGRYGTRFHLDWREAARLELKYWHLNRAYAILPLEQRGELVHTLAELHAAIFGVSVSAAWESAIRRVNSLYTVSLITGHRSADVEGDWRRAQAELRAGYRSLAGRV